jgi:hypothetical protein
MSASPHAEPITPAPRTQNTRVRVGTVPGSQVQRVRVTPWAQVQAVAGHGTPAFRENWTPKAPRADGWGQTV